MLLSRLPVCERVATGGPHADPTTQTVARQSRACRTLTRAIRAILATHHHLARIRATLHL